jgi:hypothetical protein
MEPGGPLPEGSVEERGKWADQGLTDRAAPRRRGLHTLASTAPPRRGFHTSRSAGVAMDHMLFPQLEAAVGASALAALEAKVSP